MNPEESVKKIDREIIKISIIDAPATLMVGLGLYAKFGASGEAFHPLLDNEPLVNIMLGVGAIIVFWGGYRVFTLGREKAKLIKESNL